MSVPKRWSITVPERKIAPAGSPEALAEAKKKLGPFEATHTSGRVCRCERCAEERIRKLAMRFNKLRFAKKGAPRAKHVTRNLDGVARKSRELAAALKSLDDYSRDWLLTPRKPVENEPEGSLLFEKSKASELPPPSTVAPGDGKFVEQMIALDHYVRLMSDRFEIWRLLNSPYAIKDAGGNTNMFNQYFGSPDHALVIGAYHLYEDFKPDGVRKTEHGSFHQFVDQVFLFATGSPRGQTSLYACIKVLLGRNGVLKLPSEHDSSGVL